MSFSFYAYTVGILYQLWVHDVSNDTRKNSIIIQIHNARHAKASCPLTALITRMIRSRGLVFNASIHFDVRITTSEFKTLLLHLRWIVITSQARFIVIG